MTRCDDERVLTLLRDIEPPPTPPDRLDAVNRRVRGAEGRRLSLLAAAMSVVLVAGVASAAALAGRSNEQTLTVAESARTTQAAGTARVTLRVEVVRSTQALLPVGELMTVSGPVDFGSNSYVLRGTFQQSKFEIRRIGKDTWSHFELSLAGFPAGAVPTKRKPWTHSVESSGGSQDVLAAANPSELLEALTTKGTTVRQSIEGDRTRIVVRISPTALGGVGEDGGKPVEVTVDSDGSGRIRLLSYEHTLRGLGTSRATMRYDDFGVEVQVSPPPADQVEEVRPGSGDGFQTGPLRVGSGGSAADKKRACDAIREVVAQQSAPSNEEQKRAYEQFKTLEKQYCG